MAKSVLFLLAIEAFKAFMVGLPKAGTSKGYCGCCIYTTHEQE
jgi:hypothetical protein